MVPIKIFSKLSNPLIFIKKKHTTHKNIFCRSPLIPLCSNKEIVLLQTRNMKSCFGKHALSHS